MSLCKVIKLSLLLSFVTYTSTFQFSNPLKRRVSILQAKNNGGAPIPFYSRLDVSIPYDAAARLAYEKSDKSLTFTDFKAKYLIEAKTLVKSKQANYVDVSIPYGAAAKLAYEKSDKSLTFKEFEAQYLAEAVALVKSKQKSNPEPPKAPKQKLVPSDKFIVNRLEKEKQKLYYFLKDDLVRKKKMYIRNERVGILVDTRQGCSHVLMFCSR